jgi:hypothetical protein
MCGSDLNFLPLVKKGNKFSDLKFFFFFKIYVPTELLSILQDILYFVELVNGLVVWQVITICATYSSIN